jgi:dUTP pyrophosphatase
MNQIEIKIVRDQDSQDLPLPKYETLNSAGMDLIAANQQDIIIMPGQRMLIPTGISIALPDGHEAQIRPRSGLAAKYGVTVCNTPGTIDSDYRGEVKVLLINLSDVEFLVSRGMRIAQMVIAPVVRAKLVEVSTLDQTDRGSGGFGSTGV